MAILTPALTGVIPAVYTGHSFCVGTTGPVSLVGGYRRAISRDRDYLHAMTSRCRIDPVGGQNNANLWPLEFHHGINGTRFRDTLEMLGNPNVTFAAVANTITRDAGSFLDDGLSVGQSITISGTTSNNLTRTISVATALVLTVTAALVNEGPITNVTIGGSLRLSSVLPGTAPRLVQLVVSFFGTNGCALDDATVDQELADATRHWNRVDTLIGGGLARGVAINCTERYDSGGANLPRTARFNTGFQAALDASTMAARIVLVDTTGLLINPTDFNADGIHPDDSGHEKEAVVIDAGIHNALGYASP